jgi:hypothetical protein
MFYSTFALSCLPSDHWSRCVHQIHVDKHLPGSRALLFINQEDMYVITIMSSFHGNVLLIVALLGAAVANINFEKANVLFNIGALHSVLATRQDLTSEPGLKAALTHFQVT